jgi:trimethylamine--corrinoid protein Co-methyltransferase
MLAQGIAVLSPEDREKIHAAALDVLEQAGVWIEEDELREQLRGRGAPPLSPPDRLAIPRALVGECLGAVNRRPALRCVNGKELPHGPEDRYYSSLVTDPYIVDFREGVRRPRLEDIARHARLGDALPLVGCIHLMDDTIPELSPHVSELKGIETFVANTTTAYHCAPGSEQGTRYWIEIAGIMAGGSLEENPILAAYVPTVSPLALTAFNTRQLRAFLAAGVQCHVGPCAIAGATAPYPVAGLTVQSWAEFLAALVAALVIAPGAPVVGGGGGGHAMDMRSGESLYSGVSKALASAAINELCAWLDLPAHSGNFSTLCSGYGVQNGMECTLGVFATFFSRVNCFGSFGSLANACGMSATQIMLHHDLAETLERFRRGIDLADEKLAVASIVGAGPRGNFLEDTLTLKYMRSDEHFFASCFEQCAGTRDEKSMAERAWEQAEDLIVSHTPAVPEERLEDVHRYVERELAQSHE